MKHQRILQDELSSCRFSTTSHGDRKTTRKNARQMLNSSLSLQRYLEQDNGHSSVLIQRKSGILSVKIPHKGQWDQTAELVMLKFAESGHPVFRTTSTLSRGMLKSKGGGKYPLLCRPGNDYFCKSAQSLRCSRRNV